MVTANEVAALLLPAFCWMLISVAVNELASIVSENVRLRPSVFMLIVNDSSTGLVVSAV